MEKQLTITEYVNNHTELIHKKIIVHERLKQLRKDKRLTAAAVAKYLNIPRPTYSCYEARKGVSNSYREAPIEIIARLAEFYNVSVDFILGLTDKPTPHSSNIDVMELLQTSNIDNDLKNFIKKELTKILNEQSISVAM